MHYTQNSKFVSDCYHITTLLDVKHSLKMQTGVFCLNESLESISLNFRHLFNFSSFTFVFVSI